MGGRSLLLNSLLSRVTVTTFIDGFKGEEGKEERRDGSGNGGGGRRRD